jgi:Arc/MetJ-type ribon-helix-helix transcriptional regulator
MSEKMSTKLDELVDGGAYVTYADAIRHSLALLYKENDLKHSD